MSVRYSIEPMKVGFGESKREAFVGRAQLGETVETDMLVEQVSLRTGMTKAMVKLVLENLTDSIQHFCKLGSGVRVGKLGIIKPSINSKSAAEADDVEVVKLRYKFLPSTSMHDALRELSVRKVDDSNDEGVVDEDDDDSGNGGGGGQEFT